MSEWGSRGTGRAMSRLPGGRCSPPFPECRWVRVVDAVHRRADGFGWRRPLFALLCVPVMLSACDRFFAIDMTVVDCVSNEALSRSSVTLTAGASRVWTHRADVSGHIAVQLNAPENAIVLAEISAPGYKSEKRRFAGKPSAPIVICLSRGVEK